MPTPRPIPAAADPAALRDAFGRRAAAELEAAIADATAPRRHGRMDDWQAALQGLPEVETGWRIEAGVLVAGAAADEPAPVAERLKVLIPWRKGPLRLGGLLIDTEWRSDWKWDRIAPHLDLAGKRVLDIGAGNGYFGWRMLADGGANVIGCDPTLVFWMQHRAIRHFSGPAPTDLLPLPFEVLPATGAFDLVFSMGVLYHRRDPLEHLARIRNHLAAGGTAVIETLVLPGDGDEELDPPDRYANMRNVHRLPTVPRLLAWLDDAGFGSVRVLDVTPTTTDEQRPTEWMPFHSLAHALDATGRRTVEGHPPPLRAAVAVARD